MSAETFLNGRVTLHAGDSRDVLKTLADSSIDSIVCDPPYALVSIVKRFGAGNAAAVKVPEGGSGAYARASAGFMGKTWDTGETAFATEFWVECLRVLKPGGHVVAFSGTRTYHRMACAIEDAGFEVRDMLGYLYGSGFPKSHNISRAIGVCLCEAIPERDVRSLQKADVSQAVNTGDERGEVLLSLVPEQGSPATGRAQHAGDVRVEKPGVEGRRDIPQAARQLRQRALRALPAGIDIDGADGRLRDGASPSDGPLGRANIDPDRVCSPSRSHPPEQPAIKSGNVAGQPEPQISGAWQDCGRCGKPLVPAGLGTALKPAQEPIFLGRKPLIGTVAANVLQHGTGAINIDGCRIETGENLNGGAYSGGSKNLADATSYATGVNAGEYVQPTGRWPANIIHDGSDEVTSRFPFSASGIGAVKRATGADTGGNSSSAYGKESRPAGTPMICHGDDGSASRFFYTAKADADDRLGSKHPTVKPVDLMQWLCRLVTPKGGTVLDPFAGTGTTGEAAFREGFNAILIEREPEYQADIRRRMALCMSGPDERKRESIKAKVGDVPFEPGSLFAGIEAAE